MGGGVSSGKSESSSDSQGQFKQDVWGGQTPALQNLYSQIGSLFGQTNDGMQGQISGATDWMNQIRDQSSPYWQNQMQGGAYQGMDLQNQYNQALGGGGNEQFMNEQIMGGAGNNYVDAMKDTMARDAQTSLGGQLAMNDARASGAGMSGSSRHGITESGVYSDTAQQLSDAQTRLGYDTFDKDMQRKMDIARNADQFDMNKIQNLSGMLGQQQNTMNQGLAGASGMQNLGMGTFSPYMAPWQMTGQYANAIGRPTILGEGTMSGDSDSKGKSMSASGGK